MSPKRRRIVSDDESCANQHHSNCNITRRSCYFDTSSLCSLYDVPDGPLLSILSFCTKLESNWDQAKFALCTLSFLSKAMRERILALVQNSLPVDIDKSLLEPPPSSTSTSSFLSSSKSSSSSSISHASNCHCHDDMHTACKFHMKLKSLCLMFDDQVYKSIFIHILNSCNVSCLQTLSFHVHPTNCDLDLLNICDEMGVPLDRIHRAVLLSNWAFQEHVACILQQKQCPVKNLRLRFKIEETLHGHMFQSLSTSLEELHLEGWCSLPNPDSYLIARSLSCLANEFEHLTKLKHVDVLWPRLRRDVLISLKSYSLESLCLKGGLKIDNLDCPHLKKLTLILNTSMMDVGILHQCRKMLMDLTLVISNSSSIEYQLFSDDDDGLSAIIENLPVLKRFSLVTNAGHALNIKSSSLEEINLYDAPNLSFKSCICPKLQKICCRYQQQGLHRDQVGSGGGSGSDGNSSLRGAPFDGPLVAMDADTTGYLWELLELQKNTSGSSTGNLSFTIGNSQFVGMEVPKSCAVELLASG
mmetsp:Transcript_15401/g.29022  ORF Transcript_15401/g.29022 Transcript_15401/m.29022 type:complete len:529 (+) Transcript_15401:405-1991(+)